MVSAGVLWAVLAVSLLGAVRASDAAAATGDLTQKPGTAGCVSDTGAGPRIDGAGLDEASSVTVSPGGGSVYVASPRRQLLPALGRRRKKQ